MSENRLFDLPDLSVLETNFAARLLEQPLLPLSAEVIPVRLDPVKVYGGVYAIFYFGDFPPYRLLSNLNLLQDCPWPVYVGSTSQRSANAVRIRLGRHANSIRSVDNLRIEDFRCRFLLVPTQWISSAKQQALEHFRPLWNYQVTGFGNNSTGKGRNGQRLSDWDVLHSGRPHAKNLHPNPRSRREIIPLVEQTLARPPAASRSMTSNLRID